VVKFSRFSVKEFFSSDWLARSSGDVSRYHIFLEPAHAILAKACLGVLLNSKYFNIHIWANFGLSPLHVAASPLVKRVHVDIMQALLDRGADPGGKMVFMEIVRGQSKARACCSSTVKL
jgi:hypothetical protein